MSTIKNICILVVLVNFSFVFGSSSWEKRVYLATYPRSGNHWTRYMIEEATHLTTSSVYKDRGHYAKAPWGGYYKPGGYFNKCKLPKKHQPFLVKTHYPTFGAPTEYDLLPSMITIRIVRHPIDSFYSFYLYMDKSKVGTKITHSKVKSFCESWRIFQEYWEGQPNVITLRYEDMLENPYDHLKLILEAIGYNVPENLIRKAVKKHPPKGSMLKHLNMYDKEDLEYIESELRDMMDKYGYYELLTKSC